MFSKVILVERLYFMFLNQAFIKGVGFKRKSQSFVTDTPDRTQKLCISLLFFCFFFKLFERKQISHLKYGEGKSISAWCLSYKHTVLLLKSGKRFV